MTLITFGHPPRLYTATEMDVARQRQYWQGSKIMQRKHSIDSPLSQTNISLSLSLIQKQCEKLMEDEQTELTLEDSNEPGRAISDSFNPYNSGD